MAPRVLRNALKSLLGRHEVQCLIASIVKNSARVLRSTGLGFLARLYILGYDWKDQIISYSWSSTRSPVKRELSAIESATDLKLASARSC